MSEANPKQNVYLIVDRGGANHRVLADRMLTEGREVTFTVAGREVGSFFDPLSAQISVPDVEPSAVSALVPGEVCMTSFVSSERGLLPSVLVLVALSAASLSLQCFELFRAVG